MSCRPARSLVLAAAVLALVPSTAAAADVEIRTLSNRADLISGGNATVEVILPDSVDPGDAGITLNGKDVRASFERRGERRFEGLLTGLAVGKNDVVVRVPGRRGARLTVTNHPKGGPVFAGRQVTPWICTTEENGLGKAVDDQCNAPAKITYQYKSSLDGGFKTYNPSAPASDVATTRTDHGVTTPYIVRIETGAVDRGIYQTAVLANPTKPWTRDTPQKTWNHKLYVPFGGSCGTTHGQRSTSTNPVDAVFLNDALLSRGFMATSSGLNVYATNCNEVVSAEALMMQKEHIEEAYGRIRYTIGVGCSGGSIQVHNIAGAYPGLLDGIVPACSFPDAWQVITDATDCTLLDRYFLTISPQLWPLAAQHALVQGKANVGSSCAAWVATFSDDTDPQVRGPFAVGFSTRGGCDLPADQTYHPQTNPKGVRCSIQDYQGAIWGYRASDGFAKFPLDNIGVQYGLQAVNSGEITPEQFVDMNAKIGGYDIDGNLIGDRMALDDGVAEIMFRAGRATDPRQLANVPIIDVRGFDPVEVHQDYTSYVTRARLDEANGTHANHVILTGPLPILGQPGLFDEAALKMDRWLAAVERDDRELPLAEKIIRNKPASVVDTCYAGSVKITDTTTCRNLFPYYGDPRIAAGGPFSSNVRKCQLRPLERGDYEASFSDAQWATLQRTFAAGVCDWRLPSVGFQRSIPWMTYGPGPGGTPLGNAPRSVPFGPKVCGSRRTVTFTLPKRIRGRARVTVGGRTVKAVRRGRRVTVSLAGLPRRPVKVVVRTRGYVRRTTINPCRTRR